MSNVTNKKVLVHRARREHSPSIQHIMRPILAIGILSVDSDSYQWRRTEQRFAWVNSAHAAAPLVHARFVFRCGAPLYTPSTSGGWLEEISDALRSENATHADAVCLDVPRDAGRLKGPSLGVVAWFDHVLREHASHRDNHILDAHHAHLRFVATVDDDAYIHVADLLRTLRHRPAETSPYVYAGAIVGWSFHAPTYRFRSFGWGGCANCSGPFPFAVGAFLCMSLPLARAVVDGTRDEVLAVHALPRNHTLFFQDVFIGMAVHRLARIDDAIDVLQLEHLAQDTDGFAIPPHLAIWHNRWKIRCRVLALGDYYDDARGYRCNGGVLNLSWTRLTRIQGGRVNMTQYRFWVPSSVQRVGLWHPLSGEAARVNRTCTTAVDLRNPASARALNLTGYLGCIEAEHQKKMARAGR